MTPWSLIHPGYQVRIKGVVWRVLDVQKDPFRVTMEAPQRGVRTGSPNPDTEVDVVYIGDEGRLQMPGEQFFHPAQAKRLHEARLKSGILDDPAAQTPEGEPAEVDEGVAGIAEEMGVTPHDVALAMFQVRLGAQIIADRDALGKIRCPPHDTVDTATYKAHLFLLHGIYFPETRTSRKQLDEAHEASHERKDALYYVEHQHTG